jgi:RNA 2',3'-cyclic 3'-phosphodiesterase
MSKRIFAAVNLSIEVTRRLHELQRTLRPKVDPEVRVSWVPAANLHVTLKFYGDMPDEQVEAAADALAKAASGRPGFTLVTRGLGVFPDPARPRVLWAGLTEGVTALVSLAEAVEGTSVALGFGRESRPFHAHVTLARIKAGGAGIAELLKAHEATTFPASPVSEVVLYESRLLKTGAEYVALRRVPLGEVSAPGAA